MNIGSLVAGTGTAASPGAAPPPTAATVKASRAASPGPTAAQPTTFLDGLLGANAASAQRRAEELGTLLARFVRTALTGSSGAAATSSSPSSSGALAFLKDARLSVEEKLARLMVYLSDKYDKQLEQKMQQYANLENGGKATASSPSKSASSGSTALTDGLGALLTKAGLGKLLSGGSLQKLLGQVTGPALAAAATALGMPSLAPSILKAGPLLGSLASGAVTALTAANGTGAAASTSKASSSSGSTSTSSSETSEKQLMTEIQILQEKQKEMFTLVSNILRAQHDTKMAVISNVR